MLELLSMRGVVATTRSADHSCEDISLHENVQPLCVAGKAYEWSLLCEGFLGASLGHKWSHKMTLPQSVIRCNFALPPPFERRIEFDGCERPCLNC